MPALFTDTLANWTGGHWDRDPIRPLTGLVIDSRLLRPGQVFVALTTGQRDGHDFLLDAQLAGASAAIVSQVDTRLVLPQLLVPDTLAALQAIGRGKREIFGGPVVGITGSAGKTSTKDLIGILLGGPIQTLLTEGNLNNHIGVPLTLSRLDYPGHRYAVIEAGISAPGEMEVLADMIQPDVALVTMIGPAHLENLRDLAGVAEAKAMLPRRLRPGGLLVTHGEVMEQPAFQALTGRRLIAREEDAADGPSDDTFTYGIRQQEGLTVIQLSLPDEAPREYHMRAVSEGMARNAVLALATARHLGVAPSDLQERLGHWMPTAMRAELRREGERLLYVDCYNANPASMEDALVHFDTVAPAEQPRLYVLGGMEDLGFRAAEFHRDLGAKLRLRPQDFAFLIGEYAGAMCAGAVAGGCEPGQMAVVSQHEPIMRHLSQFQGAVFIKGSRRWELEKVICPVEIPSSPC